MEGKIVYCPRHLWTSSYVSTALCLRLSRSTLCVVSLGSKSTSELELFSSKAFKSDCIVLFDAQVAALGRFHTLHSPQRMRQIGKAFSSANHCKEGPRLFEPRGGWLLEAMGYYLVYVPFEVLLAMATSYQRFVHDAKSPSWLPVLGGKRLAELSTFLAVLSQHIYNAASLPKRLRALYLLYKQCGPSHDEHMALGHVALTYLGGIIAPIFHTTYISPSAFVKFLRGNVEWLMDAPAGFKLNKPLASILGNGIILWLDLWNFVFKKISRLVSGGNLGWLILRVSGKMGLTLQLTLLVDLLNVTTWYSHWIYLYFAKLNRLQFGLFSSLSKLFLGKKINVLRHRVDTCEYDVGQLLLGTLLLTILVFLVTTNFVFFVFFAGVRASILLMWLLLWLPVVTLSSLPVASLFFRILNPRHFIVGMRIEVEESHAINSVDIDNVGVGYQSPTLEAQNRQKLRQTLASWKTNKRGESQGIIFQLVPVPSSLAAQFTRLRAYSQAVKERYSLAAIVKACLFGSAEIERVPLSLLFEIDEANN
ncbi:hypothetical protein PsorP6_013605 [Peronosclerospora sorghi]|uniref:Uncharacterized protein n=1 Tax=Peronosclerospora sorghi TaxID=230839 RepID=A0ACC0VI07_9STRA|nr:hypothetical protein PsorP6_013605 [Peronosclerospora sorghi]